MRRYLAVLAATSCQLTRYCGLAPTLPTSGIMASHARAPRRPPPQPAALLLAVTPAEAPGPSWAVLALLAAHLGYLRTLVPADADSRPRCSLPPPDHSRRTRILSGPHGGAGWCYVPGMWVGVQV